MHTIQPHRATAAILALSLLWALPAHAQETAVEAEAATSAETIIGPAADMATLSNSDAMALAMKSKRKPARIVRTPSPRLAALSNHDWGCSGVWCGRQFVLMIGIGF
jgi:hypothetical protein